MGTIYDDSEEPTDDRSLETILEFEAQNKLMRTIAKGVSATPVELDTEGTSLQGTLEGVWYNTVRANFGSPMVVDGGIKWVIAFDHPSPEVERVVATIYHENVSSSLSRINEWKIGGFNSRAALLVQHWFSNE
jgi:hypothetical protein